MSRPKSADVYVNTQYPSGAFDQTNMKPVQKLGRRAFVAQSHIERTKQQVKRAAENGCAYLTFEIEVKKDWKGGGSIYCPTMQYESGSRDLAKDVASLIKEFIDVEGGEQL